MHAEMMRVTLEIAAKTIFDAEVGNDAAGDRRMRWRSCSRISCIASTA